MYFYKANLHQYVNAIISLFLIFFIINQANLQRVRFATRFRNFNLSSEIDSAELMNMTIFQFQMEHKLAVTFNLTKNVIAKIIGVTLYRCTYENAACEYFQNWKFTENLKGIVYMKNQIWTPLFTYLTPRLEFPVIKKGVYRTPNATLSADAVMLFYSEAVKYYFKIIVDVGDGTPNYKKAIILFFEVGFFEYVERNRKKDKGN